VALRGNSKSRAPPLHLDPAEDGWHKIRRPPKLGPGKKELSRTHSRPVHSPKSGLGGHTPPQSKGELRGFFFFWSIRLSVIPFLRKGRDPSPRFTDTTPGFYQVEKLPFPALVKVFFWEPITFPGELGALFV